MPPTAAAAAAAAEQQQQVDDDDDHSASFDFTTLLLYVFPDGYNYSDHHDGDAPRSSSSSRQRQPQQQQQHEDDHLDETSTSTSIIIKQMVETEIEWPKSRKTVSKLQAQQSLQELHAHAAHAHRGGLSNPQLWLVSLLLLHWPYNNNNNNNNAHRHEKKKSKKKKKADKDDDESDEEDSSHHHRRDFVESGTILIKSLLPRKLQCEKEEPEQQEENENHSKKQQQQQIAVLSDICNRFIMRFGQQQNSHFRKWIMQFFLLLYRYHNHDLFENCCCWLGSSSLSSSSKQQQQRMYYQNILFSWILNDCHYLHHRIGRENKKKKKKDKHQQHQLGKVTVRHVLMHLIRPESLSKHQLVQLRAAINVRETNNKSNNNPLSMPSDDDVIWNFLLSDPLPSSKNDSQKTMTEDAASSYIIDDRQWEDDFRRCALAANNDPAVAGNNDGRPSKRPRRSFRNGWFHLMMKNGKNRNQVMLEWMASASASELLQNTYVRQLFVGKKNRRSTDDDNNNDDDGQQNLVRSRFRSVLPYKLQEQWVCITSAASYTQRRQRDDDERRLLLLSIWDFALLVDDNLPPEIPTFLTQKQHELLLLTDGETLGPLLFQVIGSCCCPKRPLGSANSNSVWMIFHQMFLYGTDACCYRLVVHVLAEWVRQYWKRYRRRAAEDAVHVLEELRILIHRAEELILKRFLLMDKNRSTLCLEAAAVEFYHVVCDCYHADLDSGDPIVQMVALPTSALMYRFLLSSSAWTVDRACMLLVRYKPIFQKWKELPTMAVENYVKMLNCYIWDFCSVLWRCSPIHHPESKRRGSKNEDKARNYSILFTDLTPKTRNVLYNLSKKGANASSSTPAASRVAPHNALSLTHGAVFASFAAKFLEASRHQHPLLSSLDQICGKIKIQYLEFLKSQGLQGIHEFLSTFVGSLAARRQRQRLG